ncbi:Phospholipase A1-II 1 [Platanthera zijinensis]|uniref:Phospholipase A1 n=1 Tax=Platanthera zijinensis TaxID=2320716 RepID=A0AAP0B9Z1_9ASPA
MAKQWCELNGENNWEGLLDPLDPDLRRHVINYGELSQAVYDAFNDDKLSRFTGAPRYGRRDFFHKVFLTAGRPYEYRVTKFLYATSGLELPEGIILKSLTKNWKMQESSWLGYVAVSTEKGTAAAGRRDVLIAWRGTVRPLEWVNDIDFKLVPADEIVGSGSSNGGGGGGGAGGYGAKVHEGWMSVYTSKGPANSTFSKTSAREQVLKEVRRLIDLHQDEEVSITLTGHSLGAAVATLTALDIVAHDLNKPTCRKDRAAPVTAIVFASPRVGDAAFKKSFEGLAPELRLLRVTNAPDLVPKYPLLGYADIGVELAVNAQESEFLKSPGGPAGWHSLEAYMHGVAGTQGSKGGFKMEVDRDIALLNKYMDAVKDEFLVPVSWWVVENKGMVQGAEGHWRLEDHEHDDDGDDDKFMKKLLEDDF